MGHFVLSLCIIISFVVFMQSFEAMDSLKTAQEQMEQAIAGNTQLPGNLNDITPGTGSAR